MVEQNFYRKEIKMTESAYPPGHHLHGHDDALEQYTRDREIDSLLEPDISDQLQDELYTRDEEPELSHDQLQNELLSLSHHIDDIEVSIEKGENEYALEGLKDAKEIVARLAQFLPPDMGSELDRMAEDVIKKIDEGTATIGDFQALIESPEAIRNRVRRHMRPKKGGIRQDDDGHTETGLPSFGDRIKPKRKPGHQQDKGGARRAHRDSSRTQERTMSKSLKNSRFSEAAEFIANNIGKEVAAHILEQVNDKPMLLVAAKRLMSVPNIDRDWLNSLCHELRVHDGR